VGVDGAGGNDRVTGSAVSLFETFFGGPGSDVLAGGAGFDNLIGQSGNDNLSGGPGRDGMNGGPGTDRCSGGPGKDGAVKCEKGSDRNRTRQPSRSNMMARFTSWIA
jgi:Ca2+-binding RTX toxin-like protein